MTSPTISKSKYLSGLQCHKLLWHQYNAKDVIPPVDEATQAIFDQGHLVGELAKKLFPGGIEVEADHSNLDAVNAQSKALLAQRKPLFEAGFIFNNTFARADILDPVGKDTWDIVEVKSSTEAKPVNINDLALQRYCYEGAGVPIRRCYLMHINNKYVRHGEIEPDKLFTRVDLTDDVAEAMRGVEKRVKEMLAIIGGATSPDVPIGLHCSDPYGCAMQRLCWQFLPDDNVLTLSRVNKEKAFKWISRGIVSLSDLPSDEDLSKKQDIQVRARLMDTPHVNREKIEEFIRSLRYPFYFIDFETYNTAIPPFDNVRPYQQVPFQFSVHVLAAPASVPKHLAFLAEGGKDPRKDFLGCLKKAIGDAGSVVVYNKSFELGRLKELVELMPEHKEWLEQITRRTIDLLEPFRAFHYYNPSQHGSASIKQVLPALTGKSYDGLEIGEGGTASREYMRITFTDVADDDRQKVRKALEEYCELDTQAMVDVLKVLSAL